MSFSDVVDAVSLAEKGLLSPQSFQKVVSRIVRGTDAKEPCKSAAKVVCPDAPYIDVFLTGVCSCNLLLRLVEGERNDPPDSPGPLIHTARSIRSHGSPFGSRRHGGCWERGRVEYA